jgi:hypothetical protein
MNLKKKSYKKPEGVIKTSHYIYIYIRIFFFEGIYILEFRSRIVRQLDNKNFDLYIVQIFNHKILF